MRCARKWPFGVDDGSARSSGNRSGLSAQSAAGPRAISPIRRLSAHRLTRLWRGPQAGARPLSTQIIVAKVTLGYRRAAGGRDVALTPIKCSAARRNLAAIGCLEIAAASTRPSVAGRATDSLRPRARRWLVAASTCAGIANTNLITKRRKYRSKAALRFRLERIGNHARPGVAGKRAVAMCRPRQEHANHRWPRHQ